METQDSGIFSTNKSLSCLMTLASLQERSLGCLQTPKPSNFVNELEIVYLYRRQFIVYIVLHCCSSVDTIFTFHYAFSEDMYTHNYHYNSSSNNPNSNNSSSNNSNSNNPSPYRSASTSSSPNNSTTTTTTTTTTTRTIVLPIFRQCSS